jgi:hypothetical protein
VVVVGGGVVVVVGGGVVVVVVGGVWLGSVVPPPPPPGCVIGDVPSGGLLPPWDRVVVLVLEALVVLGFEVDELLLDEVVLVSSPLVVVLPSLSVVCGEPPNCCEAGSTFWCWDCAGASCPAAIVATEANAVATTTPAAAIMTLADCRGAPLRLGGLSSARSGELT